MISGKTVVAGVAGRPIAHSLSPLLHNAWLSATGIDGVYVAFPVAEAGFQAFVSGLRGGAVRGLNVTLPFKSQALADADEVSDIARRSGAANVLVFEENGRVLADNTDGVGLLAAFRAHAPRWSVGEGPVTVLGAGGAARGAVAAMLAAGAPKVWLVNRTLARAEAIASDFGARVTPLAMSDAVRALADSTAVINATSAGLAGRGDLNLDLGLTDATTVVMDMVYKPLETPFLAKARALGRTTVDGLEMLIGQARPAFETFYGQPAPDLDVRALALRALVS